MINPPTLHMDADGRLWARLHQEGKEDIVAEVEPNSAMHKFLLVVIHLIRDGG